MSALGRGVSTADYIVCRHKDCWMQGILLFRDKPYCRAHYKEADPGFYPPTERHSHDRAAS